MPSASNPSHCPSRDFESDKTTNTISASKASDVLFRDMFSSVVAEGAFQSVWTSPMHRRELKRSPLVTFPTTLQRGGTQVPEEAALDVVHNILPELRKDTSLEIRSVQHGPPAQAEVQLLGGSQDSQPRDGNARRLHDGGNGPRRTASKIHGAIVALLSSAARAHTKAPQSSKTTPSENPHCCGGKRMSGTS